MGETRGIEPEEINLEKKQLLSNPAFQRMAGCFELYQSLYLESIDDTEREKIKHRMEAIFNRDNLIRELIDEETNPSKLKRKISPSLGARLFGSLLNNCESGNFTREKLADAIIDRPAKDGIFYQIFPQEGREIRAKENKYHVNNVFTIVADENSDYAEIFLAPSQSASIEEYIRKIIEGFCYLAMMLTYNDPKFKKIETIIMDTWLFSPEYKKIYEMLFDDRLKFLNLDKTNSTRHEDIRRMALMFSKKMLKNYLINGIKPEVYETELTRDDVKELFGSKKRVMNKLRGFFPAGNGASS